MSSSFSKSPIDSGVFGPSLAYFSEILIELRAEVRALASTVHDLGARQEEQEHPLALQLAQQGQILAQVLAAVSSTRPCAGVHSQEFYTVAEFAKIVNRRPYTIRTWIKEGTIPARRSGTGDKSRLLIPRAALDSILRHAFGAGLPPDLATSQSSHQPRSTPHEVAVPPQTGTQSNETPAGVVRDPDTESRDKWIYEQCVARVRYSDIIRELSKRFEWYPIISHQGIFAAACRYADRHGLTPPPRRRGKSPPGLPR